MPRGAPSRIFWNRQRIRCARPAHWPTNPTAHLFRDWFDVELIDLVIDADDDLPIYDDELDDESEEVTARSSHGGSFFHIRAAARTQSLREIGVAMTKPWESRRARFLRIFGEHGWSFRALPSSASRSALDPSHQQLLRRPLQSVRVQHPLLVVCGPARPRTRLARRP